MIQPKLTAHMDLYSRVLSCRSTFTAEIVSEALALASFAPEILGLLQADIELSAREGKKNRLMDEIFRDEQPPLNASVIEAIRPEDFATVDAAEFGLHDGRPRAIDAEHLLVLTVLNGVFPLTSRQGYDRLVESEVYHAILEALGGRRPARSTVGKYLDIVSPRTREAIHQALCRKIGEEGLDTFTELTVDSLSVAANSAWPTDSGLLFGLLNRIHVLLGKQAVFTGVACESKLATRWLKQLDRLHKRISMSNRPAERITLYGELLGLADRTEAKLGELLNTRRSRIEDVCILPSRRIRVDRILTAIDGSFADVAKVKSCCRQRVMEGRQAAATERALSLSDPDATMIIKGQREAVLGYKPQIGRSAEGFISCYEVPMGNAADAVRLVPMVEQHHRVTAVLPFAVSTDDGYSSAANLATLADMGIETISFSGSKGRKVIGDELWEETLGLRTDRSAVESTVFTLRHKGNLQRFSRRGGAGVAADMAESVLVYNLWRIAYVRRQRHARGVGAAPRQQAA